MYKGCMQSSSVHVCIVYHPLGRYIHHMLDSINLVSLLLLYKSMVDILDSHTQRYLSIENNNNQYH